MTPHLEALGVDPNVVHARHLCPHGHDLRLDRAPQPAGLRPTYREPSASAFSSTLAPERIPSIPTFPSWHAYS